jgi:DNA transformation protein
MFATIFGDTLYMKATGALVADYVAAGGAPFVYDTKTGPRTILGLISLPESALDDPDEALDWARKSLVIAQGVAATKAAKKRGKS